MTFDSDRTETIPVSLEDGTIFKIEVVPQGREDVSFGTQSFGELAKSIEGVLKAIAEPVQKARPTKATVKFGLEIQIEQGSLVAALVHGKGKSNLEITLEWEAKSPEKSQEKPQEKPQEKKDNA